MARVEKSVRTHTTLDARRGVLPERRWGAAKQDHTSLGTWKEWKTPTQWHFKNGQYCPSHGARDLVVDLLCGVEEEIGEVEEPATCSYRLELFTPAAC